MKKHKNEQRINRQFAPRPIAMLRSPAFRMLSLTGHRILARIEIELAGHGGKDNGKLPVTFTDFEEYGIWRHAIGLGIAEVCALGFVELTRRGRSGNGEHRTSHLFRITYLPAKGAPPTDEWHQIETIDEAKKISRKARHRDPKKQNPSDGFYTGTGIKTAPNTSDGFYTGRAKTPYSPGIKTAPLSRQDLPIYGHRDRGRHLKGDKGEGADSQVPKTRRPNSAAPKSGTTAQSPKPDSDNLSEPDAAPLRGKVVDFKRRHRKRQNHKKVPRSLAALLGSA